MQGVAAATPYQPMSPLPELPAPSPELPPQDLQRISDTSAAQQPTPPDQDQQSLPQQSSDIDPTQPQPQPQPAMTAASQPPHLPQQQRSGTSGAAAASLHAAQNAGMGPPQPQMSAVDHLALSCGAGEVGMRLGVGPQGPRANSSATVGSVQGTGLGGDGVGLGAVMLLQVAVDGSTGHTTSRGGFPRPAPTSPNHSHGMQHSISMATMPGGMGPHISGGGSTVADVSLMGLVRSTSSADKAPSGPGQQSCHMQQELDLTSHQHMLDAHLAGLQPQHRVLAQQLPVASSAAQVAAHMQPHMQAYATQLAPQLLLIDQVTMGLLLRG